MPIFRLHDADIRQLLYPQLPGGVWIDELPTGTTRADVVHITPDFMHGYELKGDGDTLARVARQLPCYASAYDLVTFVATARHTAALLLLLPEWVGLTEASAAGLRPLRPARYNATVTRVAVASLLRLDEIQQFLLARGLAGASTLRRHQVLDYLHRADGVPLADLARHARERLTARLDERLLARAERKAERDRLAPARARARARSKARRVARAELKAAKSSRKAAAKPNAKPASKAKAKASKPPKTALPKATRATRRTPD